MDRNKSKRLYKSKSKGTLFIDHLFPCNNLPTRKFPSKIILLETLPTERLGAKQLV